MEGIVCHAPRLHQDALLGVDAATHEVGAPVGVPGGVAPPLGEREVVARPPAPARERGARVPAYPAVAPATRLVGVGLEQIAFNGNK